MPWNDEDSNRGFFWKLKEREEVSVAEAMAKWYVLVITKILRNGTSFRVFAEERIGCKQQSTSDGV